MLLFRTNLKYFYLCNVKASALSRNQSAIITGVEICPLRCRLLEMGCVAGETIVLRYMAPGGDPLAFEVNGSLISLRRSEAETIRVITAREKEQAGI